MPRITGIREIRFVTPQIVDGKPTYVDPRGYKVEVVESPIEIDYYKDFLERCLIKARDQQKLCERLGHDHRPGGCQTILPSGTALCERWVRDAEASCFTPERTMLVRVDIPVDPPKETP